MFIERLIEEGYLKTPRIIDAFRAVRREDFLPPEIAGDADLNIPLPIGFGQTISQPLTVAFMFELLGPEPGDKVLDIGYGSGWTTALLAYIVSGDNATGRVFAIERVSELAKFGEENVAKYNFIKKGTVGMKCADATKGWKEEAPFQKIIAAASGGKLPPPWKEQLGVGGRIVAPLLNSIWVFDKKEGDRFEEKEYPGFAFVPLIED